MGGASAGAEPDAEDATRRDTETVVGRLAVDEELHAVRRVAVRDARAVAAALLARDKQHRDARFSARAEPLDGHHLRRENALRVARTAAKHHAAVLARRHERRDAIEVRGEDDLWRRIELREDIEPAIATGCSVTR